MPAEAQARPLADQRRQFPGDPVPDDDRIALLPAHRDPAHARAFLTRYADRLLFGRDYYGGELQAFFELINMLGLKNPCCVEYTVRDTGTGTYRLDQDFDYWPRFVPNLGILWKF